MINKPAGKSRALTIEIKDEIVSMLFEEDPKAAALRRIYRLTWWIALSVLPALLIVRYFWPPPLSWPQERDIFIGTVCFALGVVILMRVLLKVHHVTGKEYQAYAFNQPLMKIAGIIVFVSALIKFIKDFI